MSHVQDTQSACFHRAFTFIGRRVSSLLPGMRGRGCTPALCLISLCLVLLLGLPARSQSTVDDRLGPGDSIELHVWHWTALRGGVLEGLQLNRSFSIDSTGRLDLPNIGSIGAAGLRTDELAKLIADRLQARSGLPERPETIVQRILKPATETTGSVAPEGDQTAPEAMAPTAPEALKEAARTLPGEHEQALRRELAAARAALDVMQRNARDASAEAHAVADKAAKQAQDLQKQRQKAEALALDLEAARRVIEGFKAEAIVWDNEKAAMLEADRSAEASRAAVQRTLDEERHKVELVEQELAASRRAVDALKTNANLAAIEQANAIKDRQAAEAALKQAGEALALERQRADAAARDLDNMRKERDASREAAAALSAAWEQERERSVGLARILSAARQATGIVKAERRTVNMKRMPKASARKPPDKQRVKVQRSPQPDLVATIALPAALLPTRPPKPDP
ncbi:polysaccharide biosynthesis/export family protein [Mesorhizobium sp. VK23B]|uniref:Polysaccharide biosynthesis/export family protein n=1 Tax=Mesorhizobium dulcispinae TaxID=3072316 RepID=A0ABU4XKJ6_9HYPH|nr:MULTISPECIES: polysaccharide biosynthesis/export family protein [unclassified Mesorhizobium]MDX8468951.1 polysaccharide biosynthesis/export family protein [Mesorhizobium sp. VK23B]MDX8475260.1 polysaccharide biosynthesis/export family protein [Mesorhizobium sp. VK23A]